jgi:hypothetical protein
MEARKNWIRDVKLRVCLGLQAELLTAVLTRPVIRLCADQPSAASAAVDNRHKHGCARHLLPEFQSALS